MFELLCWLILAGFCSLIEVTYKGYSLTSPLLVMAIYWLRRIAILKEGKTSPNVSETDFTPSTTSTRPRNSRLQPIPEEQTS